MGLIHRGLVVQLQGTPFSENAMHHSEALDKIGKVLSWCSLGTKGVRGERGGICPAEHLGGLWVGPCPLQGGKGSPVGSHF